MNITHYDYCQQTLTLKANIEHSFLALGERLKKIRDQRLYEPSWTSFYEYCEEMKMNESTASRLIGIYEKFILEYHFEHQKLLEAGGWSVISECLPVIKSKNDAEEWLHKAKTLSRGDLRKELKEKKTGITETGCRHDYYMLRVCRKCGEKTRVYDDVDNSRLQS